MTENDDITVASTEASSVGGDDEKPDHISTSTKTDQWEISFCWFLAVALVVLIVVTVVVFGRCSFDHEDPSLDSVRASAAFRGTATERRDPHRHYRGFDGGI